VRALYVLSDTDCFGRTDTTVIDATSVFIGLKGNVMVSSVGGASSPSTDYSARADRFFSRADTNGDGKISKDEFTAVFSQRAGGNQRTADQMFAKIDANGDGTIDKSESQAFLQSVQGFHGHHHGGHGHADPTQAAARLLQAADTDGNNSLSKSELQTLAGDRLSDSQLDAFIDSADQDKDGNLSASELEAAIRSAQATRDLQYAARYVAASSDSQPPVTTYSAQA